MDLANYSEDVQEVVRKYIEDRGVCLDTALIMLNIKRSYYVGVPTSSRETLLWEETEHDDNS